MSNEVVKVVLKNTKDQIVAPQTTADQVGYENAAISGASNVVDAVNTAYTLASTAYNKAGNAYDTASNAYNKADTAWYLANNAYGAANNAYDHADAAYTQASSAYELASNTYTVASEAWSYSSTSLNYLDQVKTIFRDLAGDIYNYDREYAREMGYIISNAPTVSKVASQANDAYNMASAACNLLADSIYNRFNGKSDKAEGTYLLKATVDSNSHVTFTWVNEADYKNV